LHPHNELLSSRSGKSQSVISEAEAPGITLTLSSIELPNAVAGLKSVP